MSYHKTIYGKRDDLRNLPLIMGTLVCKKGNNIRTPTGLIRTTSAFPFLWLCLTDTSKPRGRISGFSQLLPLLTSLFPLQIILFLLFVCRVPFRLRCYFSFTLEKHNPNTEQDGYALLNSD